MHIRARGINPGRAWSQVIYRSHASFRAGRPDGTWVIAAARAVATGNNGNCTGGSYAMPIINSEMINALSEAQGVSHEKAMAAAEMIGKLEQAMLARTRFGLNMPDMVPLMLGAISGLQVLVLLVLLRR